MDVNFMGAFAGRTEDVVATEVAYSRTEAHEESKTIYQTIIRWSLIVGAFLAPILFLPWTTSILELNKQLLLIVVAGTGLVAWLLQLVSTGRLSWRSNSLDKGVLAIFVAVIAATVFSVSPMVSMFGSANSLASSLLTVSALFLIYFLIVHTVDDGGEDLICTLRVSLTVALLFGLLQMVGVHIFKFLNIESLNFAVNPAFNTIGSVNSLGVLAAITLPLLAAHTSRKWLQYVSMVGFVVALVLLVILNWWVIWMIAITGMVGIIVFRSLSESNKEGSKGFSIARFILPMTVIVIGVFLSVVNFNLEAVKKNLPLEVSPSYSLSGEVAQAAIKENPFTGYGPETFSIAFDKFGAKSLANTTISNAKFYSPNAAILKFLTEGGFVALASIVIFIWALVQAVMTTVRNHQTNSEMTTVLWATLVAVAAATLLYPFNTTLAFMSVTILALAVLNVWQGQKKTYKVEDTVYLSLASSLGFIAGLILVLVGVYFGVSAYIADAHYARAAAQPEVEKASAGLVSAINWNSRNDVYYRGASQAVLALLSQELNKKADASDTQQQARIQNYMTSAIELAKRATEVGPLEVNNWDNLGVVYQNLLGFVEGVDKLSESAYLKAAELRPGDATYYNKIGVLYLTKANLNRQLAANNSSNAAEFNKQVTESLATSEVNFKKAIEISNNFGLAIYNLGIVYDQQNKLPDAIKQLERIVPFNSDQPNLLFELGLLYYRNEEKDKAFDAMQRVLVLSPNFANARWYLALILEERKDISGAIAELKQILSMEENKDNETVMQKLTQLESGETTTPGINQEPL